MAPTTEWRAFQSPEALADALADQITDLLSEALATRGLAFLAVSGGSTPKRLFAALSSRKLDWSKVIVTLIDERFVPETSDRSNASLVRDKLLVNEAAAARFVGLYRDADDVDAAAIQAGKDLSALPWPLDVAILGMGADGHTASFFPDADDLPQLLDPARPELVMPVHADSAGEPRLTLPIGRLLEARFLALHIEGDEKRSVLEDALQPGAALPITAVFANSSKPVHVYWAG